MKIENIEHYKQALAQVYTLMNKGENKLTETELTQISEMAQAIEFYENNVLNLVPTKPNIGNLIITKLKEKHLSQKALAELFDMSRAKVSQIISGKQKPDIEFLKLSKDKLGIDGNLLLDLV
jgi:antitoxin component HigA of HigAB toxin-antitoxin module